MYCNREVPLKVKMLYINRFPEGSDESSGQSSIQWKYSQPRWPNLVSCGQHVTLYLTHCDLM